MKIVITDIPDDGLTVDICEKIILEDIAAASPVAARFEISRTASEVIVSGTVRTELEPQCSRCLKNFRQDVDLPVNVVYHPLEEMGEERHELKDDEMDLGFYDGEAIDLQELIREQLLLSLTMKPLCSDDCRGMCPKCGTDLNEAACTCVTKEIDPRLEVLKKLLEQRKE